MCAIVGFISKNPNANSIMTLKRLFFESKIRGMHAYGYTALGKTLKTKKSHSLKELIESIDKPNILIGHCRYSTSGDYLNHNNNQPLSFQNEHLVFNGVIDMRTKPEMEKAYGIKMNSDNDGEIMLQSPDRLGLLQSHISFAGILLKDKKMTVMRNANRPAYMAVKHDAVYIGSTADILRRALLDPQPLEPNKEYEWAV